MTKLIGILVTITQLHVAIDGDQKDVVFPNTADGAQRLFEHVHDSVLPAPRGIFLLVYCMDDNASQDVVFDYLHKFGIKYGSVIPEQIEAAAKPMSAIAVIKGFQMRLEKMTGRK